MMFHGQRIRKDDVRILQTPIKDLTSWERQRLKELLLKWNVNMEIIE